MSQRPAGTALVPHLVWKILALDTINVFQNVINSTRTLRRLLLAENVCF